MRFLCIIFITCLMMGCAPMTLSKNDRDLLEKISSQEKKNRELSEKVASQQELTLQVLLLQQEELDKIKEEFNAIRVEAERVKLHSRH